MKNKIDLDKFTTKGRCISKCNREVIPLVDGPIIVCTECKRILMDKRKKNG